MSGYLVKVSTQMEEWEILELWRASLDDGTLKYVFANGTTSLRNFTRTVKNADRFCGVYDDDGFPVGFFYLSDSDDEHNSVDIHFCILHSNRDDRHAIGKAALDWVFKDTGRDVIFGFIPMLFIGTIAYAIDMGFQDIGRVDNASYIHRVRRYVSSRLLMLARKDFYYGQSFKGRQFGTEGGSAGAGGIVSFGAGASCFGG